MAECINLKDSPENVKKRIENAMAYPAYHMNKQHWYTVLLDGHLEDKVIYDLIKISYILVQ